jgi:hypothetical protein
VGKTSAGQSMPGTEQMNGTAHDGPGAAILNAVYEFLGRFVAYPSEAAHVAHTLWIAHTHLMDAWESTPRICFMSPEPGSGKSRALEITNLLVPNPVEAINVSVAYLFRKVGGTGGRPTILFDEIDTVFGPKAKENEDLRGLLNAGHRRSAKAGRCVVHGKTVSTEEIPAYCAVAMAGLGHLPDTILTRSVIVRMRRRAPDERVDPYRHRNHDHLGHVLRDQLADWAIMVGQRALATVPVMPDGVEDRNADVWEPLIAVADLAGGTWPERSRVSSVTLVSLLSEGTGSLGIRLLTDLRTIFVQEHMSTGSILADLQEIEDAPWGDLKGRPINSLKLSRLLRDYGVKPKQVRVATGKSVKGYAREDLHDVWLRYLPSPCVLRKGKHPKHTEQHPK